MQFAIADGWTALAGETNVYYREVTSANNTDYPIIAGNTVTVKSNVTKSMMSNLTSNPTLIFTAYAVQKAGFNTAVDAWPTALAQANPTT